MAIPIKFRKEGEGAVASFDFVDLASGVGFTTFFGAASISGSVASYALITTALPSSIKETVQTNTGKKTMNFDTSPFNLPRTVKGTMLFSTGFTSNLGGASTGTSLAVALYKYDGTTETNIAASQALNNTAVLFYTSQALFQMPCTQTIIKKDERLRLKVVSEVVTPGTGELFSVAHNPTGENAAYVNATSGASTIMRAAIPFRIDL